MARAGACVQNRTAKNPRTAHACRKRAWDEIRQAKISRRRSGRRSHSPEPAGSTREGVDRIAEPLKRSMKSIPWKNLGFFSDPRRCSRVGARASVLASTKEQFVAEKLQLAVENRLPCDESFVHPSA